MDAAGHYGKPHGECAAAAAHPQLDRRNILKLEGRRADALNEEMELSAGVRRTEIPDRFVEAHDCEAIGRQLDREGESAPFDGQNRGKSKVAFLGHRPVEERIQSHRQSF